jgi:hypothetical protein
VSPHQSGPATSAASAASAVIGTWTGTYYCNQGLTGMRMTITSAGGDEVRALIDFYAVPSNPGVSSGSAEETGNYTATTGLVLIPDYWINQPFGYVMVGLSAPPPNGNSMHGIVQGENCTTFSASR